MMTKCHHSDSSKSMSELQESLKKKTLYAISRFPQILSMFCRTLFLFIFFSCGGGGGGMGGEGAYKRLKHCVCLHCVEVYTRQKL